MAIVFAIQKWHHYVLGNKFIVQTDQRSLKYMLEHRIINSGYQKWVTKLLGFDFEIQFQPRLDNKAVDALSHLIPSLELSLSALTMPYSMDIQEVDVQVQKDPIYRKSSQTC